MLEKVNERLEFYSIIPTNKVICEDGKYHQHKHADGLMGYAVVNKEFEIIEFTTMRLPEAIFQADYLDKAMVSMTTEEKESTVNDEVPTGDDVIPLKH